MSTKDSKLIWTSSHQSQLNNLVNEVKQQTLLSFPNPILPYTLEADISEKGLGSVLKQEEKTIDFYSHRLNGPELNYTIPEKETYSILLVFANLKTLCLIHTSL